MYMYSVHCTVQYYSINWSTKCILNIKKRKKYFSVQISTKTEYLIIIFQFKKLVVYDVSLQYNVLNSIDNILADYSIVRVVLVHYSTVLYCTRT